MQDQECPRVENAGPENAAPDYPDRKMEDQRSERVFCDGNMRDCVVFKGSCKTATVHST